MKVAVSIPDPIFAEAEALAKRLNISRSKLFARALDTFLSKHSPEAMTAAINAAIDAVGEDHEPDPFVREAGRRIFSKSEW